MKTTVYPSRAGGFPAASFFTLADAMAYAQQMALSRPPCGVMVCPALSYPKHNTQK